MGVPLSLDIAGDPDNDRILGKQRLSVAIGVLSGAAAVVLIILLVLTARQCGALGKNGYEAGKKEPEEDFFTPRPPSQPPPEKKKRRDTDKRDVRSKSERSLYAGIVTVNSCRRTDEEEEEEEEVEEEQEVSQRIGTRRHRSSPDLARHYKSSSPLPAVHLQPNSPPVEGKKHQAVQDLPPTNTFTGNGNGNADAMSLSSDHCSDYSCHNTKYSKPVRFHHSFP